MTASTSRPRRIAVLGGTGKEGTGLALRWAWAGHEVIIGSREAAKAERVAGELNGRLGEQLARSRAEGAERPIVPVRGLENATAAHEAEIAALTVPYAAHRATLENLRNELRGKVLIDVTVPLDPAHVRRVWTPPGGSAGAEAQAILGSEVRVVSAFQNVSFERLQELNGGDVGCDVLVCGDDREAKREVIQLVQDIGTRGFDAGPIENAKVVEGLTAVLINVNVIFKIKHAGIRITGVPEG